MAWVKIAHLEDIPRLGSRVLPTEQGNIAIFRSSADQVFAVRDRCPHKGGVLSQGIVHGCKVTCPLHSWIIDLEQGEAVAPDVGHVKTFAVKVEQNEVYLNLV
jgi:nitrite reductase (NADH) small subunit